MSEEKLVGTIQKNKQEQIRISTRVFNGYALCDIRVWRNGSEGKPVPTTKGLSIRRNFVPELIRLLGTALKGQELKYFDKTGAR